ncbi:MAG: N-acetyltransferase [Thermosulfidibacteraceae bacterium]|jgi:amino-acid N-acetyltransferase
MIRKAKMSDVDAVTTIINSMAKEGFLLPVRPSKVAEFIRDYFVWEEAGKVVGCARLKIFSRELGEIRSVAVLPEYRGTSIGSNLVLKCIKEARDIGLKKVFVLTKVPNFFCKFGFREVSKRELPHKVWEDCIGCPKFHSCDEVAMILEL